MKNFFIKNFLSLADANFFRNQLEKEIEFNKINNLEELLDSKKYQSLINQNLINLVEENLNIKEFIFLNIVKFQKKTTYYVDPKHGWHKDFGGRKDQLKILSKKSNFIFKIGIYLQKNEKNLGGGIDLLKTMLFDDLAINNKVMSFIRRVYYFFLIKFFDNMLKTDVGSVVGFNGLIYHRTSPMKVDNNANHKNKYSIYFLITNFDTIKDSIKIYDQKYNTNKYEMLDENLFLKKFGDSKISLCSKEYSTYVEHILGD